ncbi:hypothetical protein SPBR_02482 [Sporothrix brasiliensis 5110]|uniref:Major facilitator superfamily transporter n=1 Tax=Sporothrix brasiliensis 5110 TaxID=1398154 RepID=A0A0C2FQ88_9PEZI|nr:uncharacterized protein SPBR_02482 [Sporothrix brasiliensis 5110]KIH93188.1 hypothetical protein SPBR_02482 [Sporothrix brasiliensis 5110]
MAASERTPLLSTASTATTVTANTSAAATPVDADATLSRPLSKDGVDAVTATPKTSWLASLWSPANRVLLVGFIISLSFSFTQVTIFYAFRLMECDVFYSNHPPFTGPGDRCSRNEITAGTARQVSLLGISTTFCGTWNLFISGRQVKRLGPRAALVLQTSIPALRVATQVVGVYAGGQAGIWIFQVTQIITVLGGPAGYILVVNTIAGEVVAPIERTALFGKLQGVIMLGMAIGLLLGGVVGDTFGIVRPFQTAFFLFLFASAFAHYAMPYISPESLSGPGAKTNRPGGLAGFLEPLKVMLPQKIRLRAGRVASHYGIFFLCCGEFLGVLATGYAPMLLQMYATATFDFDQTNNGWLMSGNAFMRAFFLVLIFPRIIDAGRAWFARRAREERRAKRTNRRLSSSSSSSSATVSTTAKTPKATVKSYGATATSPSSSSSSSSSNSAAATAVATPVIPDIPTQPEQFDAPNATLVEEEPILVTVPTGESSPLAHGDDGDDAEDAATAAADDEKAAYAFDLFFLRWSLLVDGIITAGAALGTQPWHMYLITVLLPFGSGSAPAAKGVITTMCPSSQRADALNAITLVENMARLATLGLFGYVFAALADVGQAQLTFYCNGALAVVAMAVLMFSHFPPRDSVLVEAGEAEAGEAEADTVAAAETEADSIEA